MTSCLQRVSATFADAPFDRQALSDGCWRNEFGSSGYGTYEGSDSRPDASKSDWAT